MKHKSNDVKSHGYIDDSHYLILVNFKFLYKLENIVSVEH